MSSDDKTFAAFVVLKLSRQTMGTYLPSSADSNGSFDEHR